MAPSFVLRIDAGPRVGYGHAGRCLALWEQLRDRCQIAVADSAAAAFVGRWGARVAPADARGDVTIIDRAPAAEVGEVQAARDAGAAVCLIDDAGPARDLAQAVVDPPTGPSWPPAGGARLGGFEHALVREEIRAARSDPLPGVGVLVSLGGSDPTGLTAPLCAALDRAGIATTAVLGPGYDGLRPSGAVLGDPALWPRALAGAELLVTGFGHTLLEAAHVGVAALAVPRHERDAREAAAFAAHGTMDWASADDVVASVGALHGSDRVREMRRAGPALVDGRGAERVARVLEELGMSLEGRVALVTGGSRGIGRAAALALAAAGADVAITYRERAADAAAVVAQLGGRAVSIRADLGPAAAATDLIGEVTSALGTVDVLVNNAGVLEQKPFAEITEADLDRALDVNLKAVFLLSQAVMGPMLERRWGRIVNIASSGGQLGGPLAVHYSASKAGVIGLTRSLARVGAPHVTVNCVSPGLIETEMTHAEIASPAGARKLSETPLARAGTPDEVAAAIAFLADSASFVTGQTLNVNGGLYLG